MKTPPPFEKALADLLAGVGYFLELGFRSLLNIRRIYFYRRQVFEQFYAVTMGSLPVIFLASCFTGMVIATQTAEQIQEILLPRMVIGAGFLTAVLVEFGPVLTALILAGRIGAGIAAELGTMRVSEQIDALESMALEPEGFLVMPRVLAGFLMLPILNIASCAVSIVAGYLTLFVSVGLSFQVFAQGMKWSFQFADLWQSTIKAFAFGGLITLVACFFGLRCGPGAKGVGSATTTAVVVALLGILALDYLIAKAFVVL